MKSGDAGAILACEPYDLHEGKNCTGIRTVHSTIVDCWHTQSIEKHRNGTGTNGAMVQRGMRDAVASLSRIA